MDNGPWKTEMARFVKDMVALATPYLAKNGGPIVMAQIENEYGWNYPSYISWVGELVASLNISVPWIMCNGHSAKDTVNTNIIMAMTARHMLKATMPSSLGSLWQ